MDYHFIYSRSFYLESISVGNPMINGNRGWKER